MHPSRKEQTSRRWAEEEEETISLFSSIVSIHFAGHRTAIPPSHPIPSIHIRFWNNV